MPSLHAFNGGTQVTWQMHRSGCQTFFPQRATAVIVGWFTGCTRKKSQYVAYPTSKIIVQSLAYTYNLQMWPRAPWRKLVGHIQPMDWTLDTHGLGNVEVLPTHAVRLLSQLQQSQLKFVQIILLETVEMGKCRHYPWQTPENEVDSWQVWWPWWPSHWSDYISNFRAAANA